MSATKDAKSGGKKALASGTSIQSCNCTSAYQDATYGQGKRVHNRTSGSKTGDWRCTVCARTH